MRVTTWTMTIKAEVRQPLHCLSDLFATFSGNESLNGRCNERHPFVESSALPNQGPHWCNRAVDNIPMLINRRRGYKNLCYLLLKAKRLAVSNLELLAIRRIVKAV